MTRISVSTPKTGPNSDFGRFPLSLGTPQRLLNFETFDRLSDGTHSVRQWWRLKLDTTPFIAHLSTKYGYFKGQNYRLVFEMPAHATAEVNLTSSVSGWYFANLVFGGGIGMLIVDPLTGAMFNLSPEKLDQNLTATQAKVIKDRTGFLVVLSSQITENERAQMVRVN